MNAPNRLDPASRTSRGIHQNAKQKHMQALDIELENPNIPVRDIGMSSEDSYDNIQEVDKK